MRSSVVLAGTDRSSPGVPPVIHCVIFRMPAATGNHSGSLSIPAVPLTPTFGRSTFAARHLTADFGSGRNSRLVPMLPEQDLTVFGRVRLINESAFL